MNEKLRSNALSVLLSILIANSVVAVTAKMTVTTFSPQAKLTFVPNHGQWNENALFQTKGTRHTTWFTPNGAYHQFIRSQSARVQEFEKIRDQNPFENKPNEYESFTLNQLFVDANSNPLILSEGLQNFYCNYFFGNDPSKWQPNVPTYNSILYVDVYPGIDVRFFGDGKHLNYDFIVAPGADLSKVKIRYEGVDSLRVDNSGQLVIETSWGQLKERELFVYQSFAGPEFAIEAKYFLYDKNTYGFELLEPPANPFLATVIDPVLEYSTYLGGSGEDFCGDIVTNASGEVYLVGSTSSINFPTLNSYQATSGGGYDAFVTKLENSGSSMVYSTYLGGSATEICADLTVDAAGQVFITGWTTSTDFPTINPFQGTFGGIRDAFVTKLNSAGNSLVYSTYLGGSALDYDNAIVANAAGEIYVTGATASSDFPTLNPYQGTNQGGTSDAFITKLSSTGNSLVYSSYLGGSDYDVGNEIGLNTNGAVCIAGLTVSPDFPTFNPYQGTFQGGGADVFVTKLNSIDNSLVYSTYLGGSNYELGGDIVLDAGGAAYVTGFTDSPDFPTLNPYQATFQGGDKDVFVTKLNGIGNSLVYSTYLGGSNYDIGIDIMLDAAGEAHVTGSTDSPDFPTLNSYQGTYQGGSPFGGDAFVSKLNNTGNILIYSTYLGGSSDEQGNDLAIDGDGAAHVTGYTYSSDFPLLNPFQGTFGGMRDAFVSKFDCCINDRGDLNGDGIDANVLDLTYIIDRIFRNGPPVGCPEEGDVNGDGSSVNIVDLTFLIDRLFRQGPPPPPC